MFAIARGWNSSEFKFLKVKRIVNVTHFLLLYSSYHAYINKDQLSDFGTPKTANSFLKVNAFGLKDLVCLHILYGSMNRFLPVVHIQYAKHQSVV